MCIRDRYKIGPTIAMGINITYVVWSIIFDKLFLTKGFDLSKDIKVLACALLVIAGVYFVAKEQDVYKRQRYNRAKEYLKKL